jgi:hypothetical protein
MPIDLGSGAVIPMDILRFTFPAGLSESGPYHIFAGMINPETGELLGDYSGFGFVIR